MMTRLEKWEAWPLWALGLSNGTNIALGFVLSMVRLRAPELRMTVLPQLVTVLPIIVVLAGIAAAISLDGVLIATIAGMRHGRSGVWSVLTIIGAALFSGAFAYALHADLLDQSPFLHVAQAVVLALYNLHLSQRRKPLQSADYSSANGQSDTKPLVLSDRLKLSDDGYFCRKCGDGPYDTLADVRRHQKEAICVDRLPVGTQRESPAIHTNGHEV